MTYSEKLKDPKWKALRTEFIASRKVEGEVFCDDCGEDTCGRTLHVHHRLYRRGAEPWEYSFDELRLICVECHNRIHDTEQRARAFVRSVSPHICYELNSLIEELSQLRPGLLKIVIARARREAINLPYY